MTNNSPSLSQTHKAVECEWTVEDIAQRMPDWSEERCQRFLNDHRNAIVSAMLDAGGEEIDRLLPR